jgi:hypothetical protein
MSSIPKSPERLEEGLCGVLERGMQEGVLGACYLKGGVAMELRFAQRARATKDLDHPGHLGAAGRLAISTVYFRLWPHRAGNSSGTLRLLCFRLGKR